MRFAGSAVENYLGSGPNMGALTQNAASRDAEQVIQGFSNAAKVGGMGAQQLGSTLAAQAVGAAQENLAGAQANAQMMGTIGKLGGQALGGLGSMGGGGEFSFDSSMPSFSGGYTPSSDINFGSIW